MKLHRRAAGGGERETSRPRRRHRLRWVAAGVLAAAAVAGAVAGRAMTESLPAAAAAFLLPDRTTLPGPGSLSWPRAGEAAVSTASGTLLGSSGRDAPLPIASLAKVMTAYVVLRDRPLEPGQGGPTLTVTPAEAAQLPAELQADDSVVALAAGQTIDEREALQALLIASADNVADMLATFDAGSQQAFVQRMNAEAGALGMERTHYADPSGLDPATVSDPTDQLRLARAALADPVFAKIVSERSALLPGIGELANYNSLVGTDGFTGIKTGSTEAAGGCLVFSVVRAVGTAPYPLLGVVLGQRGGPYVAAALRSAKALADSVYEALRARVALPAGTPVLAISRAGQRRLTRTTEPLRLLGLPGQRVRLTLRRVGHLLCVLRGTSPTASASLLVKAEPPGPPTIWWRLAHLLA